MDEAIAVLYEGGAGCSGICCNTVAPKREVLFMRFSTALLLSLCSVIAIGPFLRGQAAPADPIPILPPATLGPQLILWSQLQPQPVPQPLPKLRDAKNKNTDKGSRGSQSDPDHKPSASTVNSEDRRKAQ
jgi:hypothetical protein